MDDRIRQISKEIIAFVDISTAVKVRHPRNTRKRNGVDRPNCAIPPSLLVAACHHSAINRQDSTSDPRTLIGREEEDSTRDIARLADTP